MSEASKTGQLLAIAMGEATSEGLNEDELRSVSMIRTMIETIQGDVADPVPAGVITHASALSSALPKPPSWFDRAVAVVLAPLVDDRPQLAFGIRGDGLRQSTFAADGLRLDLELQEDDGEDPIGQGASRVRGQIDSEDAVLDRVDVAVFLHGTDRVVATTTTEPNGRFDLVLPPGDFDLAFRLDENTQTLGRIEIP